MALLTRKRLILAKAESPYGTDSSPDGTDAVLVRTLEITPIEADVVSRELIRPYLGNSDQLLANTRVSITFEVELAGSGTAATAPRFGSLLKACGRGLKLLVARHRFVNQRRERRVMIQLPPGAGLRLALGRLPFPLHSIPGKGRRQLHPRRLMIRPHHRALTER